MKKPPTVLTGETLLRTRWINVAFENNDGSVKCFRIRTRLATAKPTSICRQPDTPSGGTGLFLWGVASIWRAGSPRGSLPPPSGDRGGWLRCRRRRRLHLSWSEMDAKKKKNVICVLWLEHWLMTTLAMERLSTCHCGLYCCHLKDYAIRTAKRVILPRPDCTPPNVN